MELIEIIFNYKGALIEAEIYPEDNCKGLLYPVNLNGVYSFTLSFNDEEGWNVMRESDGMIPVVEDELFGLISRQLKWELNHVA
jgi:hypothetical protein